MAIALWVLVVVAAAALVTAISAGGEGIDAPLDPENPAPPGAQAIARVLQQRGVELTVVRSQAELLRQTIDGETTLLVASTHDLSGRTASAALAHASDAARVVLVEPPPAILTGLRLPVTAAQHSAENLRSGCVLDELDPADRISEAEVTYQPKPGTSGATVCFPSRGTGGTAGGKADGDGTADGEPSGEGTADGQPGGDGEPGGDGDGDGDGDGGYYVSLPATDGRPAVSLLGSAPILTNELVTESDNAALALRLLGGTDRLLWYVPDVTDIEVGDPTSVEALIPPAIGPGLALGASAVVALCLWRGRRLGRLVTEPLPVVVRAVETTESRGRMYRKARDRRRALAILQAATRSRLTAYLGLPVGTDTMTVAAAAAAVSGRPYPDVLALLQTTADPTADPTAGDATFVAHAGQLATLEKEVRRP